MHGVYERLPNEAEIARPPLVIAEAPIEADHHRGDRFRLA